MSKLHYATLRDISYLVVPLQLSVPIYKSLRWALNDPRERKNRLLKHLNIDLPDFGHEWGDAFTIAKNNTRAQFMYLDGCMAVLLTLIPNIRYSALIWNGNDFFAKNDHETNRISERFFFYLLQAAIDLLNNGYEEDVDISMWFHRKTAEYDSLNQ